MIPLLTFLLLAELGLRVYLTRHTLYDVEMSRYATEFKMPAENPRIGHVHRPGREGRLMNVEVRINADGLRDDELPRERGEARRLIFLGDSLTFGWGVEQPQTFEHLLERRLSEEVAPTEIVNFGTGNYNTTQEVQLFLEKGLAYAPDAVVVFYFINDAEPVPRRSRWWWLGYSRLMTLYWSRIEALTARFSPATGFRQYYAALYADDQPGWQEARESLLELSAVCAERRHPAPGGDPARLSPARRLPLRSRARDDPRVPGRHTASPSSIWRLALRTREIRRRSGWRETTRTPTRGGTR